MEDTLDDDGMFCFLGVTTNGSHTCKDDCTPRPCCPIGYNDIKQRDNYWPRLRGAVDYVTQGLVSVYAESEITVKNCGNLHVRVEITDEEAEVCQQIGGVTAVADAGTQPLTLDHRIETGAQAGCAVLLELK